MKNILLIVLLFAATIASAQVGIGTTTPKAVLDIPATNNATPANTDGILIPRINTFPVTNPTVDQNGMMVFLTADLPGNPKGFYYWDDSATSWKNMKGNPAWSLTGNSGTVDGTNFIGTNDNVALSFKVNGKKSGRIEGASFMNTFLGYESGLSNTPSIFQGMNNAGFGYQTLRSNTTGFQNTAIGRDAMYSNVTGDDNTALGFGTLSENIGGSGNVAVGSAALYANQGSDNVAVGSVAMTVNNSGYSNVAVGSRAMNNNDDGYQNIAIGTDALAGNHSGYSNTAIGYQSLNINIASSNTAVGGYSLFYNLNGQNNAAIGVSAAYHNNDGNNNTAIGVESLMTNTNGNANTAMGRGALSATTGSNNTALGNNAGANIGNGSNNIAIGNASAVPNGASSDQMSIGNVIYGTAMSTMALGKIGIGVQVPTEKLEVAGKTKTTTLQMTTAAGAGKILVSDAAGNGAWTSPTGIASGTLDQAYDFGGAGLGKTIIADAGAVTINGTDGLVSTGTYGSGAIMPAGAGTRMVWNPAKAAFRVGGVGGIEWDNANVGNYSFATGVGTTASGLGSFAAGLSTVASGQNAVAFGIDNFATAMSAVVWGANSTASDTYTTAFGSFTAASGFAATAFGQQSTASGFVSTAFGSQNTASWSYSAAFGKKNTSSGEASLAAGIANTSPSYGETVLGIGATNYTMSVGGNSTYNANDRLFTIGNGRDANLDGVFQLGEQSNAMVVLKNGNTGIGADPIISNKLYTYHYQLTANGDGQSSIYGYRTRDTQNDGTGYGYFVTNSAVKGYNLWGDLYTFGTTGFCYNDYTRTGGVLGGNFDGTYWASLGYKNSGSTVYGIYASAAGYAQGVGRPTASSSGQEYTIGGGFFGDIIGSWSKGNIGSISSGSMFASYNSGDEYTAGRQVEIVETANGKKAAFTMTSTEPVVYKKGKITLVNGTAHIAFDNDYAALLGDIPIVTTTPMGQCNGIYIESVDKTGFTIKELNNGASNVSVSWIAVGDRIDANNQISESVLDKNFDENVNEVMFNENNKNESAKAIWSDGNRLQFGELPENLKLKSLKKE